MAARPRARKLPKTNWEWDWHWRSIAAVVYFVILIFDFVAMPAYREITYNKLTVTQMVKIAQSMTEPTAQVETLKILKEDRKWTPLTNDMIHLSFGAILGVAALPSNRRRRRNARDPYRGYDEEMDDDSDGEGDEPYSRHGASNRGGSTDPEEGRDGLPPQTGSMG